MSRRIRHEGRDEGAAEQPTDPQGSGGQVRRSSADGVEIREWPGVRAGDAGAPASSWQWPDIIRVPVLPSRRKHEFSVTPPGSKSLSNRAVLLAALAEGQSTIRGALIDADDAARMLKALGQLGAVIEHRESSELVIRGVGGRWTLPPDGVELNLNNAGTATRFLAAAAVLGDAPIVIDGNARMRERPIAELAEVLPQLGARVDYLGRSGFPPLRIVPPRALGREPGAAKTLELPTTRSSQFISALLLIAPWLSTGLTLRLKGYITSASYIRMTIGLLADLGAVVKESEDLHILRILGSDGQRGLSAGRPGGGLPGFEYSVEPDASGATYFWTAAAMIPGLTCRVQGLGDRSLQGDAGYPSLLERMGAGIEATTSELIVSGPPQLRAILADMSEMPDAAMSLASAACFATGTSVMRGLETLRVKETDRIEAMRKELTKIGVKVDVAIKGDPDAVSITPPPGGLDCSADVAPVEFDTYDDHRMAMSLALIGLRRPNVWIKHPRCVMKTYPTFWRDLAKVYE